MTTSGTGGDLDEPVVTTDYTTKLAAGYLAVDRRGSGRGKPTVYRLTLTPERLRHDRIKPTLPAAPGLEEG
jgi:hypothetical protein